MKSIELSWADFKSNVTSRNLQIQYYTQGTVYHLLAFDGPLYFSCDIEQDEIPSADQTDFETNFMSSSNQKIGNSVTNIPFGSKVLPDGTKLYRRKHGFRSNLIPNGQSGTITLTVPYAHCKINLIEFVNGKEDLLVDFKVLDSVNGDYTTVPNYVLNQFGFGCEMPNGLYVDKSEYDADLYISMQIKIDIQNDSGADIIVKGNIVYHEVV